MGRRSRKFKQKAKIAQSLRPETTPPAPGERSQIVWLPQKVAGVRVNEYTALTYAAVFACVKVISEDLAKLPWRARKYRLGGQGSDLMLGSVQDWLIHYEANPETSAFQFRETLIAHALTWGNGYGEIERDAARRPVWVWQLTPDRVTPARDARGNLVYVVQNPGRDSTILPAEDVFHLRGLGFDGLVGYSVISLAAKSIGIGLALDEETSSNAENDSTPGGLLKYPHRLTKEARDNLRESWTRRHMGPSKRRTVGILEEGMEWQQLGLPAKDMEVLSSRQFQPEDICRWFRVPPHKIASLLRATFSNIEHSAIEYVGDTLLPWARRLECEADRKLFGRTNRGTMFTKLNLMGLLRGDATARGDFYTKLLDRGVFSINDVLELEDRNPIGSDGDQRFVPVNMQLLEKAGEEPAEEIDLVDSGAGNLLNRVAVDVTEGKLSIGVARVLIRVSFPGLSDKDFDAYFAELEKAPAAPAEEPAEPTDKPEADTQEPESMAGTLMPLLEDACRRVRRREQHRAQDALKRLGDDSVAFAGWYEKFKAEHRDYLTGALLPIVQVLARLVGGTEEAARVALALFADDRLGVLRDFASMLGEDDLSSSDALDLNNRVLAACAAGRNGVAVGS